MVLAPVEFRDEEYEVPVQVFRNEGISVTTFSKGVSECHGMRGSVVLVDSPIGVFSVDDFNAVVFVGGGGAKVYFDDEQVLAIAHNMNQAGKVVGAICIAPSILANAGVLKGKRATSFTSEHENLIAKGAEVVNEDVVVDGNIVTGNGPTAAERFANEIVRLLS